MRIPVRIPSYRLSRRRRSWPYVIVTYLDILTGDQQGRLHRYCSELRHGLLDERGHQDRGGRVQECWRPHR